MATLSEKVQSALDHDEGALEYGDYPTPEENRAESCHSKDDLRDLTEYEMDLQQWGVVYGVAWAIARSEDPFEHGKTVAERAFEAAHRAWVDYKPEVPIGQPPMHFRKKGDGGSWPRPSLGATDGAAG